MINKAYKYRIYPTKKQAKALEECFGAVRYVWNHNVEIFESYSSFGPNRKSKTSTELRMFHKWMSGSSAAAQQQKEIDFKTFAKNFFSKKRKLKIGRPSFKSKKDRQSFRLPNQKFTLLVGKIKLEKIGKVRCTQDRLPEPDCKFMNVTVSRNKDGKYFASVLVQEEIKNKFIPTGKTVGIDLGLKDFCTLSDGRKVANPKYLRENQSKLRSAQKNLSRKKKGSSRFKKCVKRVARIHSKIERQRNHFLHQVSIELVRDFDFIGIEDLVVSNLLKNRKLSKAVADVSWSKFAQLLTYKADWHSKIVQKVGRFSPSSRLCSDCGWKNVELKLHDREWFCKDCGVIHDRDVNASVNIEREAIRLCST